MRDQLVNPAIYRRVGLDAHAARQQALTNPHHRRHKQEGFDKLRRFLEDQDIFRGRARERWRAAGFIA
jgi:hypothetical protein